MVHASPEESDFPRRLRQAREKKGLSQADVAERAGLHPSAVSHFETGGRMPSFDNLRALANALGETTDFLLGRDPKPGAAGPEVQQVHRNMERMSAADLKTLAELAKMLADRNKPKKPPEVEE